MLYIKLVVYRAVAGAVNKAPLSTALLTALNGAVGLLWRNMPTSSIAWAINGSRVSPWVPEPSCGMVFFVSCQAVFAQYRRVMDKQTHGQRSFSAF